MSKARDLARVETKASAWVNFNGNDGSIRDHYNVSSVTDHGTGDYTINFLNALADSNYSFYTGVQGGNLVSCLQNGSRASPSTTALPVHVIDDTDTKTDNGIVCVSVFGGN